MVPTLRDPTPKPPASRAGFRRAPESQLGPSGCLTKGCNKEQDMCQCEGARAGTGSPSQQRIGVSLCSFAGYAVSVLLWQQAVGKRPPTCKQTCLAVFQ